MFMTIQSCLLLLLYKLKQAQLVLDLTELRVVFVIIISTDSASQLVAQPTTEILVNHVMPTANLALTQLFIVVSRVMN